MFLLGHEQSITVIKLYPGRAGYPGNYFSKKRLANIFPA